MVQQRCVNPIDAGVNRLLDFAIAILIHIEAIPHLNEMGEALDAF